VRLEAYFNLNLTAGAVDAAFDFYDTVSGQRSTTNSMGCARIQAGGAFSTFSPPFRVVAVFTGLTPNVNHTFQLYYYKTSGTLTLSNNGNPIVL
jgi:hypothetical protein